MTECRPCGSRWTGTRMCHCCGRGSFGGCGLTFGGVTAFDKHRVHGRCINPARSPLFVESRPGVWSGAGPNGWEKGGTDSAAGAT